MSVYIPEDQRDTRYPLWYELYPCKVPYIQSMSIEELQTKGIYVSGNAAYDHATAWEPRLMSISVVKMIEHWANGANVYVLNIEKHCRKIYEDIQKHLKAWAIHRNSAYNIGNFPEADLKLMDEFNAVMFEHAKWVDAKVVWDGMISQRRSNVVSIASFSELWERRDYERQAQKDRDRNSVHGQRYQSKHGTKFDADPQTHRNTLDAVQDMSHAGVDPLQIHAPRSTWSDMFAEYGGR